MLLWRLLSQRIVQHLELYDAFSFLLFCSMVTRHLIIEETSLNKKGIRSAKLFGDATSDH